jgi:hypothetical protein
MKKTPKGGSNKIIKMRQQSPIIVNEVCNGRWKEKRKEWKTENRLLFVLRSGVSKSPLESKALCLRLVGHIYSQP